MEKEKKLNPSLPSGFEDRWDKKLVLKKQLLKEIENNFIKFGAEALETPSFEISENIGSFLAEDEASSSAKNDPIFSLISKEGVSNASAPNLIKLFSISFKSCFFKTNFLSQRSSNPDGSEGLSFFSFSILVVLWVGYAPTTSDPQTDVILFHHQSLY